MFEWPDNTRSLNDSLPFHYQTLPSLCPSPFVFVVHRNRNSVPKFCICFLLFLMMSATPLEIDYIGLSKTSASGSYSCPKTELSLCLPGSESPGSNQVLGLSLFGPESGQGFSSVKSKNGGRCKDFGGCGGKRGFADSSGKWGLSVNGGSEGEVGKGAALFSHGAGKCVDIGKKRGELKDMDIDEGTASQKSLQEKKSVNGPGSAPAAKAQVVGWPPIRSFRKNSMACATTTKNNSNEGDGKSGSTCLYVKVSMDGAPYLRKVDLKLYKNYRELSLALRIMFSCFPVGKDGDDLPSECVLTYEDKDGDWMLVGDVPWDMFTSTCKRMRIMK